MWNQQISDRESKSIDLVGTFPNEVPIYNILFLVIIIYTEENLFSVK